MIPSDRWKAYALMLERAANLPVTAPGRDGLLHFTKVCRPREDWASLPHLRIGHLHSSTPDRVEALPYAPTKTLIDADGRTISDVAPLLYDLSGCTILPAGIVKCGNVLSVDEFRGGPMDWREKGWVTKTPEQIGFWDYDGANDSCMIPPETLNKTVDLPDSEAYFLFHSTYGNVNFGHFLHDVMAQLQVYRLLCDRLKQPLKPIFTSPGPNAPLMSFPMQRFLFKQLICPVEQVLHVKAAPVRAKRCFTSNFMMPNPSLPEPRICVGAFAYLQHELSNIHRKLPGEGASGFERVYISRGDVNRADRRFHNLPEMESLLKNAGFKTVVPTEHPPAELVKIMSSARVIVGVHGAGLMNMMLAPPHPRVIELLDVQFSWQSISVVSAASGFDHHRIAPVPGNKETAGLPSIDLDRLAALLG